MSFSLTTPQFKARTKSVTRRLGWKNLKVGERVMACEKCQGLKLGEHVVEIGEIEIVGARREELYRMMDDDCAREGFPEMAAEQFIEMFCAHNKGTNRTTEITRIEFKYL